MDLELSTGDEIPEHDTRSLVRNLVNYLPIFADLIKVIPDQSKVDGMIAQAMGGSAVRYTGVKSEVKVTEEKATLLTKVFGAKKTEEVVRTDVEGLLWCRAAEVNNVGVGRNQLCSLEFNSGYHSALDTFCSIPGINTLLAHPQVPIAGVMHCISSFGKKELEFLTGVVGFAASVDAKLPLVAGLDVTKLDAGSLLHGLPQLPRENVFGYICDILRRTSRLDNEEGMLIGTEPSSKHYLVKSEVGYCAYSVDISPLLATFGDGCMPLTHADKLSDFALKLAELEKVRANGFGYIQENFSIVVPGTPSKLIGASVPNSFGKADNDLLVESVPKLVELLKLPNLSGHETIVLGRILGKPSNLRIVDGVLKLLALPAGERGVLEDKTLRMAGYDSRKVTGLDRFYAAMILAETAYNICKSDKQAVGVTIKQGNNTNNRRYLKWSDGEFKIVGQPKSVVQVKLPPTDVSKDIWNAYKPTGVATAGFGCPLPCPDFIAAADPNVVKALFGIIGTGNFTTPTGRLVPTESGYGRDYGRKSASIGKLSQIYDLKKNQKVLIADAEKKAERIYAVRDKDGVFMLRKPYNRNPNIVLSEYIPIDFSRPGPQGEHTVANHEQLGQIPSKFLNQQGEAGFGTYERCLEGVMLVDKSGNQIEFKTNYPKEEIGRVSLDAKDSASKIAENAGMELTRLMKSGLPLNKAVKTLLGDARFKSVSDYDALEIFDAPFIF